MEKALADGKVKCIGVSNFEKDHLEDILSMPDLEQKLAFNQAGDPALAIGVGDYYWLEITTFASWKFLSWKLPACYTLGNSLD